MITGKTYKWLKFTAQIVLPALGTMYFTIAFIWNIPAPEKVVGTIVAVDTFLGAILHISQQNFKKQIATGTMNLTESDRGKTYLLELDNDPEYELPGKKEVRLKVVQHKATRRKRAS